MIARGLGYVSVRWTVDTWGWRSTQSPAGAVRRIIAHLEPAVIRAVRARGYRFVTLATVRPPR